MHRNVVPALLFLQTTLNVLGQATQRDAFPVRGLHLAAPSTADLPSVVTFIREQLPRLGVNVLVLEVNFRFQYQSHPELRGENALSPEEIGSVVEACRKAGVQLIPQFNCLGHQSWKKTTFPLLTVYPEFDETPGLYPENDGIYCRSYCPRHPKLHKILFELMDELADAFQASAFHVGMDEVFLLGEKTCPRCGGASRADLFAEEVSRLHKHLSSRNLRMWMWGDRFLEGAVSGIGKWEASTEATESAVHLVPKDIVICDWHYEYAYPTAAYFAMSGFGVVSSPWRKSEVALAQLAHLNLIRQQGGREMSGRALGVLQTTWTDPGQFIRAYLGRDETVNESAREAAECFKRLFSELGGSAR